MEKKVERIIEPTRKFERCNVKPIKVLEGKVISVDNYNPRLVLDPKCYFLIKVEKGEIWVGICNYKNEMLHKIKGKDAQGLYKYIIDQGWITKLCHAAYLGKELERAALSLKYGFGYIQD